MRVPTIKASTLAAMLFFATQANAAVPGTVVLEGVLTSQGGGAAADGFYDVVFGVHDAVKDGNELWTETTKIAVQGGRFTHVLGSVQAIDVTKLIAKPKTWLSVRVAADPEMPRQLLHSGLYALAAQSLACSGCVGAAQLADGAVGAAKVGFGYAKSASNVKGGPAADLDCTACVSVDEMKFDKDIDLGGGSLKAKAIAAGAFVGDGSKLTGIVTVSGECKTGGEVVKGVKADGSLICAKAMDVAGLPADGIDEISNHLIFNQFVDNQPGVKLDIKDNDPTGSSTELTFPDIGLAQALDVHIDLTNSNLKSITVTLFDPNNAKYVLYDKGTSGTSLTGVWPSKDKTVSGDLTTWVGKNPKGKWRLLVVDGGFKNNAIDGAVNSWKIEIQTLSNKKIQIKGDLYVTGAINSKTAVVNGDLTVTGKIINSNTASGTSYTRWGAKACPAGHELLYTGYTGGTRHNTKAGPSNMLCMHSKPTYRPGNPSGGSAYVYAAEFQEATDGSNKNNYEVPCAVCFVPNMATSYVQSGRYQCDAPSQLAYDGYFWASHEGHAAGDYICIENGPEGLANSSNHDYALLYKVRAVGTTPYGGYNGSLQVTCAVCLR